MSYYKCSRCGDEFYVPENSLPDWIDKDNKRNYLCRGCAEKEEVKE